MADEEQLTVLRQGTDAWNAWRQRNPDVRVDLDGANLAEASLAVANLARASLIGASLYRAFLSGANLWGAHLRGASLWRAHLPGARLDRADLHEAVLVEANLSAAKFRGANLFGADLSRTSLVETDFRHANLTGCRVYGISAWDLKLDGAKQKDLIITPYDEPEITVDNLEVAQFIYLLLNNERVRHVIDTITSKVVLILGRFTEERKAVLDALREELRQRDYTPVLFDFEKPRSRSTMETISTLAHMARFVIADLTDARSVLQELQAVVPTNPSVPVQPLILATQDEPGMFDYFREYRWMLAPYRYPDSTRLLAALTDRVIAPAELMLSKADPPRRPVR